MNAKVIPFATTRYRCPHCGKTGANKTRMQAHADRCARDPDNRGCLTCANDKAYGLSVMTAAGPATQTERGCVAGCRDIDEIVVVGCRSWVLRSTAAE